MLLLPQAQTQLSQDIYLQSDDLMELDGAIYDEGDCYEGGAFKITKSGILQSFDNLKDNDATEEEFQEYFKLKSLANEIEAVWSDYDGWTYETDIPHCTFNIRNECEVCCVGIVFSLTDLRSWDITEAV